jgi:hypothetical protein
MKNLSCAALALMFAGVVSPTLAEEREALPSRLSVDPSISHGPGHDPARAANQRRLRHAADDGAAPAAAAKPVGHDTAGAGHRQRAKRVHAALAQGSARSM